VSSHHDLSLAVFITNIAESDFRSHCGAIALTLAPQRQAKLVMDAAMLPVPITIMPPLAPKSRAANALAIAL
jgi:hypothetical protein